MDYQDMIEMVFEYVRQYDKKKDFQRASEELRERIFGLSKKKLLPLVTQVGIIPEQIEHDSKEEKLFTKVSEIVLARCFEELGYKTSLYITRGDTADVLAKSVFHNYTLVADAKAFRLSRTAKNQKDFKVEAMDAWRGNHDYAVLCCPYFQYPRNRSAIYKQALERNVSLFSWEWFSFLIQNDVKEDIDINLSCIWDFSKRLFEKARLSNAEDNFLSEQNGFIMNRIGKPPEALQKMFFHAKQETVQRGQDEIDFWESKILEIEQYSRKQAVKELLKALKIKEKIKTIKKYVDGLEQC